MIPRDDDSERLAKERSKNLRQLLSRANRLVNLTVAEGLRERGYEGVRVAHSAILANMDLEGTRISTIAERAAIPKQVAGTLVQELHKRGYVKVVNDPSDARSKLVRFTDRGRTLMHEMFHIVAEIEARYSTVLGEPTMDGLRTGLAAILGASTLSAEP